MKGLTSEKRDLMIWQQLVKLNGTVAKHNLELYGDPATQDGGLKEEIIKNSAYRVAQEQTIRVLKAGAAFLGITNLAGIAAIILYIAKGGL